MTMGVVRPRLRGRAHAEALPKVLHGLAVEYRRVEWQPGPHGRQGLSRDHSHYPLEAELGVSVVPWSACAWQGGGLEHGGQGKNTNNPGVVRGLGSSQLNKRQKTRQVYRRDPASFARSGVALDEASLAAGHFQDWADYAWSLDRRSPAQKKLPLGTTIVG